MGLPFDVLNWLVGNRVVGSFIRTGCERPLIPSFQDGLSMATGWMERVRLLVYTVPRVADSNTAKTLEKVRGCGDRVSSGPSAGN